VVSRLKRFFVALILLALASLAVSSRQTLAHAEPKRASPPINGRVASAPAKLEVWFSEEVDTKDVRLSVKGPDGSVADQGDAAVDLFDPERKHVTVSLKPGLPSGTYVVSWHTRSVADGDSADGFFSFFVEGNSTASPVASPVTTNPATAVPPAPTPAPVVPTQTAVPASEVVNDDSFDSRAFGLAILAGVAVAIGLYLFWRLVRPKRTV
jgi:methionine-rich copper-binding protein CopC